MGRCGGVGDPQGDPGGNSGGYPMDQGGLRRRGSAGGGSAGGPGGAWGRVFKLVYIKNLIQNIAEIDSNHDPKSKEIKKKQSNHLFDRMIIL